MLGRRTRGGGQVGGGGTDRRANHDRCQARGDHQPPQRAAPRAIHDRACRCPRSRYANDRWVSRFARPASHTPKIGFPTGRTRKRRISAHIPTLGRLDSGCDSPEHRLTQCGRASNKRHVGGTPTAPSRSGGEYGRPNAPDLKRPRLDRGGADRGLAYSHESELERAAGGILSW